MLDRRSVLPQLLADLAAREPDVVAMLDVDGRTETRRELHEANLRWADAFRRLGVEPGEHVVTMLPNSHGWGWRGWVRPRYRSTRCTGAACCVTSSRTPAPRCW